MKFVVMIEEDGYQFRYWDEILEEIGDSIATSWNKHTLYEILKNQDFHINQKEFDKAINMIDEGKSFVILNSNKIDPIDLDTFLNNMFTVDDELSNE